MGSSKSVCHPRTSCTKLPTVIVTLFSALLAGSLPAAASSGSSELAAPSAGETAPATPSDAAWSTYDYLEKNKWTPPPGIPGGQPYQNWDNKLDPCTGGTWRHYDVTLPGPNGRGPERILRCDAPNLYMWVQYSPDHYATFEPFIRTTNNHDF